MQRRTLLACALVLAAAIATTVPAGALAATSAYPGSAEARTFSSSAGGWTESSGSRGLCLTSLTCPSVSNRFVSGGGAGGGQDGFIRTEIGSLTGVGGEVRGVWQSPVFTYN